MCASLGEVADHGEGAEDEVASGVVYEEDDVLVTEDGSEVLSARVPKSIEDIEALMDSAKGS